MITREIAVIDAKSHERIVRIDNFKDEFDGGLVVLRVNETQPPRTARRRD